jgi:hypothetical protein
MGYDLRSGLHDYTADPAVDGTAIDAAAVGTRVRHRRAVRAATTAVVSTAAVGALALTAFGATGLLAADPDPVAPAAVATPLPSTTPAPSPTPEPSSASEPTPPPVVAAPPVREADIDDATVVARLRAPRTGEVWSTPERAPQMEGVLSPDEFSSVWRVGQRDASTLYVVVHDSEAAQGQVGLEGVRVSGLYEVDDAGARAIVCPSARTGDVCVVDPPLPPGVTRDEATFLDTLTLPRSVDLADGWRLTTTATTSLDFYDQLLLGDARDLYGLGGETGVVADLGAAQIVQVTRDGRVGGLADVRYAIRTPYGATIDLSADDSPSGEFGRIRWDDGIARPLPDGVRAQSTAPSSGACFSGTFSVEDRHAPGDWRPAGTTPGGHRVYVPVPGGNAVSRAVRAWQAESSSGLDEVTQELVFGPAIYGYGTDEQFLAANALYAIQGPAGEWQLRLRSDAVQTVYECA